MTDNLKASAADKLVKTADAVAQAPAGDKTELDPPKDTPFTEAELAKYDGKDDHTPIYVGIKGRIYDGALTSRSVSLLAGTELTSWPVRAQSRPSATCTARAAATTSSSARTPRGASLST